MKVKIEAGAQLDLLTREEVAAELRSWHAEVRAGVKYPLFAATGTVAADGTLSITGDQLGPAEGFIWSVRRLVISGGTIDATDTAAVFINEPAPARRVLGGLNLNGVQLPQHSLVLNFGSQLVLTMTGQTPGEVIALSGQAKEVPYLLGWSL